MSLRLAARALFLAVLLGLSGPVPAATFTVTNNSDAGAGSLRDAIDQANSSAGPHLINFSGFFTITLAGPLPPLLQSTTILANGTIVDGAGQHRCFTVLVGDLLIASGMTIRNCLARGGNGGASRQGGGGGGLGAGGAVFVNSGASATLSGVSLINNAAQGGNGGALAFQNGIAGGGGGGGFGGDGGTGVDAGGGGGGYAGAGGNGGLGGAAGAAGTSSGGTGGSGSGTTSAGGGGGGGPGGGGGGDGRQSVPTSGIGGFALGGIGGTVGTGGCGQGPGSPGTFVAGGNGGVSSTLSVGGGGGGGSSGGGGGGGSDYACGGGGGDFGGGGGAGGNIGNGNSKLGGAGGFGGGGGGGADRSGPGGAAGFGGGSGGRGGAIGGAGAEAGSGGAAYGGALFVRAGGALVLSDVSISGSSVTGGTGQVNGGADGAGAFVHTGTTLVLGGAFTSTVSNPIAGPGGVRKEDAGLVILSAVNNYSGGTTVTAGQLRVTGSIGAVTATGGTLSGNGTVGDLQVTSAVLSPGVGGSGGLASGSLTMNAGSTFAVQVGATFTRLNVSGVVTLSGAPTLSVSLAPGYTHVGGTVHTLVSNDGVDAVAGTFAGLPNGAITNVGGRLFQIAYNGGTGNDITLTAVGVPSAPTVGAASAGNAQASIAFTPGADGGSPITGYTAVATGGATFDCLLSNPCVFTGLANGTTYTFTIAARNAIGTGPASAASNAVTPAGPQTITFANPGPQNFGTSPTLTAIATSGLPVSFTSSTTGVCTITSGGLLAFVTSGTCTILADQPGNAAFLPAPQVPRSFTVAALVPGAPTITAITPGDGQATIAFTTPASNGGSAITAYRANCTPGPVTSAAVASSPITILLPNGASYSCTVVATNSAGDGPASAAQGVVLGGTGVASINRVGANPTNAASVAFTVTFTRAVTGVDASDFTLAATGVTGASITSVAGSGTTYTVTVATGTGSGTLRLDLADNDSIVDGSTGVLGGPGAGNGSFSSGQAYTLDRVAPATASIIRGGAATVPPGAAVPFVVTFSKAVTGVDAGDFVVTGSGGSSGTITAVSGSGTTYTVNVNVAGAPGAVRLDVIDNDSIVDLVGNPLGGVGAGNGSFATGQSVTVQDGTLVSSVVRTGSSPTNAGSVTFAVTFSRAVTGVDASDFALTATGVSGATVTGVSGSGSTYTVTVGTGTGSGTLRLDVVDDDSITDGLAPLGGAGAGNGGFTASEVYTIDRTPPAVASIVRAGAATVPPGTSQPFTVTFSKAVTGVDAADFAVVGSGSSAGSITGVTGAGTTYTVTVAITGAPGPLRLDVDDNDSIADGVGNVLGGAGSGNGNFTAGQAYTVQDATLVSSVVRASASPTNAASVTFTVTFSRVVTGVDATDFKLATTGLSGASITGVTGSSTRYTVTVGTGTGSGTIRLDVVDDDTITDGVSPLGGAGAGNGGFTTGEAFTIDRAMPTVASITRAGPASVVAGTTQALLVTFSKPVTGVDAGDFVLAVSGTAAASIVGVAGSGTTYTVTVGITAAGASGGTVRLDVVDDDSIVDVLGNRLGGTGAANGGFTTGEAYTVAPASRSFSGSSATGSGTITASFTGGGAACAFSAPQFIPLSGHARSPPAGTAPQGTLFPHGLFDFSLVSCDPGSTVTFTITYPADVSTLQYFKYGPTPGNAMPHWYVLPAAISGNVMSFSITDGGLGDDDLAANGTLIDQGGPGTGTPVAATIPTMSEWMMFLMALALFGMASRRVPRPGRARFL